MIDAEIVLKLSEWLVRRSVLAVAILVAVFLASSIGVINVVHQNRQLYGELQRLQKQQDFLDHEYEKLLLEQSAWSEYSRIEKVSFSKLAMRVPASSEIIMVKETGR